MKKAITKAQIDMTAEIIVDNFAGGGGANLPKWCSQEITTMAELTETVAI